MVHKNEIDPLLATDVTFSGILGLQEMSTINFISFQTSIGFFKRNSGKNNTKLA